MRFLFLLYLLTTSIVGHTQNLWCSFDDCSPKWYVSGFGGINFEKDKLDSDLDIIYNNGYAIGGALGLAFQKGLKTEIEFSYRRNKIKDIQYLEFSSHVSGHFRQIAGMLNLLYQIPFKASVAPYIGAGAGYLYEKVELSGEGASSESSSDSAVRAQLIAGLCYKINCSYDLFLDYRHFLFEKDAQTQSVNLGIRYFF